MSEPKNIEEHIVQQRTSLAQNPECGTTLYNLGVALLSQQKIEEAEKNFIEAIDCSPSLAEAYVQLGGICLQRGDLDGCLDFNQRAVKARPGFSEGFGNIGFIELQKGNVDEAIRALEKAIAFNFRFIQALTTLGNAYLMKGRIDDAIDANQKALKIEPNFAIAHNNLAIAYLEKGERKLAIAHCDKAISMGYDVPEQIKTEIDSYRTSDT